MVFNQIFEGADPNASAEEQARRKLYRLKVLDYVREEVNSLDAKLGASDRAKLDQYLTGVNDLETRINKPGPTCTPIAEPGDNYPLLEHIAIMHELMVLAMRCDATRVATFMLANAGSGRTYSFLNGVNGGHHQISHHQGDPGNIAQLTTIDVWEIEMLADLLTRMDAVQEGSGTLLQHSQVFWSSEIEDGNSHAHRNLPVILAGECHGAYTPGRHIIYEGNPSTNGPPIANLFISMMAAMGVNQTTFGETGTGPLDQLA